MDASVVYLEFREVSNRIMGVMVIMSMIDDVAQCVVKNILEGSYIIQTFVLL